MKSKMSSKKLISALALGALAALALGSNACSSTQTGDPEPTSSANSAELAPLTCTPLLTAAPIFNCGAISADQISTAASIQTQLATQMQAALASLTITANVAQQQVSIASQASAFGTLFGAPIVAPLIPDGFFTTTVPLAVSTLAPNFALQATVFGLVPGVFATAATPALPVVNGSTTLTPFLNTTTNTTFAAFNAATLSTANTAAVNTAAINAATAPLTFFFSTPIATTVPLTCAATVPLGCL